jgi:glycosyltransferase involved in cell wall biosynthesis
MRLRMQLSRLVSHPERKYSYYVYCSIRGTCLQAFLLGVIAHMNIFPYRHELFSLSSLVTSRVLAKGALPCSIVSREPPIVGGMFSSDFYKNLADILGALPSGRKTYVLLALGWECESRERLEEEVKNHELLDNVEKDIECIYLCNSLKEVENLKSRGIRAEHCHQNAFLDESRYPVLSGHPKSFDAVYLARITPFKRNQLARQIKRLLLIGSYHDFESEYALDTLATLSHAVWRKRVCGFAVYRHLASARVGLCLSECEGAMYVSAEYLLCGLPVVSTPSIGGRDELFDPEYVRMVEPEPDAVAEGTYELIERDMDPQYIRDGTLRRMRPHREAFISLLESIFKREGRTFDRETAWSTFAFHKLGVRTAVSPYVSWKRLLRANSFR